jgi:phage gpG-like protein
MASIPLSALGQELERRIAQRMRTFQPDDPKLKEAMLRIGFLIESHAKLNIRKHGAIDTGRLFNSIRTEFYRQNTKVGVRVGSFGVPYAAIHEFGGVFTDRQRRAMFAALRDRGKLGPGKGIDKGVIQGNTFRKRPYLRPALVVNSDKIIDIIRGLFK